jgi:hypothetical protein
MSNTEYSLERIADRIEIQDRLYQFSRGVDRRDWALALSVYHDDAIDNHGIYSGDPKGFIEFTKKRHETVLLSMHHLSNILIEFIDPGAALVESYCFAWQSLSPENRDLRVGIDRQGVTERPIELLMISRYIDIFTKKNDSWRIQERNVIYESAMQVTEDATGPDVAGIMERGRRDESDLLWEMRRKLFAGKR